MAKSKKNKNKPKLSLTVREEQRNKLEQMASLENRSLSNLIEVMADERWEKLADRQGVDYAKTVAEIAGLTARAARPLVGSAMFYQRPLLSRGCLGSHAPGWLECNRCGGFQW